MDVPLETILSTVNNLILIVVVIIAVIKGWNFINIRPMLEWMN